MNFAELVAVSGWLCAYECIDGKSALTHMVKESKWRTPARCWEDIQREDKQSVINDYRCLVADVHGKHATVAEASRKDPDSHTLEDDSMIACRR